MVYIKAGIDYLNGVAPYYSNFEHPPLAKYIIGVFSVLGMRSYLPIVTISLIIIITYHIVHYLNDIAKAYLYTLIVITDALVINMSFFNLLDNITLVFLSLFIYVIVKYISLSSHSNVKMIYILGVLAGLSMASKWSSAYIIIPAILALILLDKKFAKNIHVFFIAAIVSYTTPFAMDFIKGGLYLFVKHNIDIAKYMIWRHSITLPLVINGFLTLISKISFWSYQYHEYLTLTIVNSAYVNYTISLLDVNKLLIELNCWLGSFAWPLMLYSSLKLFCNSIKSKDNIYAILSSAILGSALLPILHGNIAWYYLFYAVLAPIAIVKYASKKLLVMIVIINITQIVLLKLGLLSITYIFPLSIS